MSDEPSKIETTGVRDSAGRFVPGHPNISPGRPRAVDFRALIRERKGQGTLEDVLVAIFDSLAASASTGDVAAAKLLLDRLTDDDGGNQNGVVVNLTTGIPSGKASA